MLWNIAFVDVPFCLTFHYQCCQESDFDRTIRSLSTSESDCVTIRRHAALLTIFLCVPVTYLLTYLNSWLVYFSELKQFDIAFRPKFSHLFIVCLGRDASTRRRRNNRK